MERDYAKEAANLLADHDATTKPKPKAQMETPETGMPEAGPFDFAGSARRTAATVFNKYVKQQIIPTAASLAATRLPALAIPGGAGLVAAPIMEGLYQGAAGYLGEKGNQALGITPPSESSAAVQGGVAGLVAGATKGLGMLYPFAGRHGTVAVNKVAETEARRTVAKNMPVVASKNLFDEAAQQGATVPMDQTYGYVNQKITALMRHDPSVTPGNLKSKLNENYGEAGTTIYNLWRENTRNGMSMPTDRWQWHHERLGAKLGAMKSRTVSTLGSGEADQLYGHMLTDLERRAELEVSAQNTGIVRGGSEPLGPSQGGPDIATVNPVEGRAQIGTTYGVPQSSDRGLSTIPHENPNPSTKAPNYPPEPGQGNIGLGASKLLNALHTYRDEKSVERLQRYIETAAKINKGQGGDIQFNAQEVIRKLKADRFYPKAFGGEQEGVVARKEIEDLLNHLNTAPNLPAPSSFNTGSKRMMERGIATYAGYQAAGVPTAVAGFALRDVEDLAKNLSFALGTKSGRAMVRELSKTQGGLFNNRNLAVLSSYATAMRNQPMKEE